MNTMIINFHVYFSLNLPSSISGTTGRATAGPPWYRTAGLHQNVGCSTNWAYPDQWSGVTYIGSWLGRAKRGSPASLVHCNVAW